MEQFFCDGNIGRLTHIRPMLRIMYIGLYVVILCQSEIYVNNGKFPMFSNEGENGGINHMNAEFADRATDHNAGEALIDMS